MCYCREGPGGLSNKIPLEPQFMGVVDGHKRARWKGGRDGDEPGRAQSGVLICNGKYDDSE